MRNRAVRHSGRAKIFTRVDPRPGTSTLFGTSCWGRTCRLAGGPRSCTDGPPVSTERSPDGRVVRARDQVSNALALARGGRSASAERMLREALGVLERRGQYAGAARAAATLSLVLRERGQTSKANDTLRQARALYEVARDVGVPGREQEDYAEARGLLRPSDAITHGSTGHVVANTASMRALAGDVCGLLRSSDPFDETGSLPGICAWLQARLQARSVAVYRRGSMRRPLATASHFWTQALTLTGGRATLSAATIEALTRYDWPGNVRELQNVIAALSVRAPRRGVIGPSLLPHEIGYSCAAGRRTLAVARRDFEGRYVRAAMQRAGGRRGLAAQDLGLTRQGMAKLLKRLTP